MATALLLAGAPVNAQNATTTPQDYGVEVRLRPEAAPWDECAHLRPPERSPRPVVGTPDPRLLARTRAATLRLSDFGAGWNLAADHCGQLADPGPLPEGAMYATSGFGHTQLIRRLTHAMDDSIPGLYGVWSTVMAWPDAIPTEALKDKLIESAQTDCLSQASNDRIEAQVTVDDGPQIGRGTAWTTATYQDYRFTPTGLAFATETDVVVLCTYGVDITFDDVAPLGELVASRLASGAEGQTVSIAGGPGVVADAFDDAESGLFPVAAQFDEGYLTRYLAGEYQVATTQTDDEIVAFVPIPGLYRNGAISIDARLVGNTSGQYIALACQAPRNEMIVEYRLSVNPSGGMVTLMRLDDDQFTEVVGWHIDEAVKRNNATNHLELACAVDQVSALVNGKKVITLNHGPYWGRTTFWVGASSFGGQSTVDARFDNLRISQE